MFELEVVRPFMFSFLIGLLIGIERERSHPRGVQSLGMRTFALIALLGTVAASIGELWITVTMSFFLVFMLIIAYFRSTQSRGQQVDIGITTEIAAAMVFLLGYLVYTHLFRAIFTTTLMFILLVGRNRLHKLARKKITHRELNAAATILFLGVLILPFLPQEPFDPWGILNLQYIGGILFLLFIIQFVSYLLLKMFGKNLGMILMGVLGGLISSSAVILNLPEMVRKNPQLTMPAVVAAVSASIGAMTELLIIVFLVEKDLFTAILPSILVMMLLGLIPIFFIMVQETNLKTQFSHGTPLNPRYAIKLTALIVLVLFLVSLGKIYFHEEGVQIIAFLGGLFELHSVAFATALLLQQKKITLGVATLAIGLSVIASFVSKYVMLWMLNRGRLSLVSSLIFTFMIAGGVAVYYFKFAW